MLLSSFFTRSMVFAHIPRAQLLFAQEKPEIYNYVTELTARLKQRGNE